MKEKRFVITPHIDVELGLERGQLEYFLTFPENGVNSDTGVIIFVSGFGSKADSVYERDKLRPYLADKYNCIAVGVNYFGIGNRFETGATCGKADSFLSQLNKIYHIHPDDYCRDNNIDIELLVNALRKKGVNKIDTRCPMNLNIANNEYQSFGFLPAIDHLQVLGEILKAYKVNKKRIIAYGTSYGGYIALLLGKYAPNTFSIIIDNSGFVRAELMFIVGKEIPLAELFVPYADDIIIPFAADNPWTIKDKTSRYLFSGSHKCIRNLLQENHSAMSGAEYHIFHSTEDDLVPIHLKEAFVDMLNRSAISNCFQHVDRADIDGRVFKNLNHGMSASLRGIFDLVAERRQGILTKSSEGTDFDLQSEHTFACGNKSYIFKFDEGFSINVEMLG